MSVNNKLQPVVHLVVGEHCYSNAKSTDFDPLLLFTDDKEPFEPVQRHEAETANRHIENKKNERSKTWRCDGTDEWVNKHINAPGYHVVCLSPIDATERINICDHDNVMSKEKKNICDDTTYVESSNVSKDFFDVQLWKNGKKEIIPSSPIVIKNLIDFRSQLEELLAIRRSDSWRSNAIEKIRKSELVG